MHRNAYLTRLATLHWQTFFFLSVLLPESIITKTTTTTTTTRTTTIKYTEKEKEKEKEKRRIQLKDRQTNVEGQRKTHKLEFKIERTISHGGVDHR